MTENNQFNNESISQKFMNIKFFSGTQYTTRNHEQMLSLKKSGYNMPRTNLSFEVKAGI